MTCCLDSASMCISADSIIGLSVGISTGIIIISISTSSSLSTSVSTSIVLHHVALQLRIVIGKTDSSHHHLLEVTFETANVLELRQTLPCATPLGGGGGGGGGGV